MVRRTPGKASARRHQISKKDFAPLTGPESRLDRARFLNSAAIALDVPDQAPKVAKATREELVRHARLLLHYKQN